MIGWKYRSLVTLTCIVLIASSATGKLYVVFRYDDFAGDKPGVREVDETRGKIWQAEKQIDALFSKYGFEYVISIVPKYCLTDGTSFGEDLTKSHFIRQRVAAGAIEVAQHGYTHENHAGLRPKRAGEFRNRNYESQLRDITIGKEILCRALGLDKINTFVPPFNGWNANTAKALKKTGFSILSADRFFYYCSADGLAVIPSTATLQELETIADESNLHDDGIVVVLCHPTDIVKDFNNDESDKYQGHYYDLNRFDKLLGNLSLMPNVEVVTFKHLAYIFDDFSVARCRAAGIFLQQKLFWKKLLPAHLLPSQKKHAFYLSTDEYRKSLLLWQIAKAGFIIGLFVAGAIVRYIVHLALAKKWWSRIDIIAAVLFFLSVIKEIQIVLKGYHITGISAIPAFFTGSFVLALLLKIARKGTADKQLVCKANG